MGGWGRDPGEGRQPMKAAVIILAVGICAPTPTGNSGSQCRTRTSETFCPKGEGAGVFMHQPSESLAEGCSQGAEGFWLFWLLWRQARRPWAKAIRSRPEGSEVSTVGYGLSTHRLF